LRRLDDDDDEIWLNFRLGSIGKIFEESSIETNKEN
jgi:hypothetical protein